MKTELVSDITKLGTAALAAASRRGLRLRRRDSAGVTHIAGLSHFGIADTGLVRR